ncbi:MAG: PepSY domain-containing protein [Nitrospira sp. CR1.2]|nr:PepSY domain-containing protein [Nitrospira sp. CR1.2]
MIVQELKPVRPRSGAQRPTAGHPAPVADAPSSSRRAWKKLWLRLHLYVGLFGGALFVLTSLTGSLLVFYKTLDEWLNPEQVIRTVGTDQPLSDIVAGARTAHPDWSPPDTLIFPLHERDTFHAWFKDPAAAAPEERWHVVAVDPSTARPLSDRQWGNFFVSFIYELHQELLLGKPGEVFVGILALLLLLSIGSGLYLWWPSPGKLRRALTFQADGSLIRKHYDLHKLTGLVGATLLALLALTGFYLEFPDAVTTVVQWFSPVRETGPENQPRSEFTAGVSKILPEQAVAIAHAAFPDARPMWMGLPQHERDSYSVGLRQPEEVREAGGQTEVWIDQYSGAVLRAQDWREFTGGETFLAWLFPLHNGEALGLIGRWLILAAGLMPLLLYATALRMWWLKRDAHRRRREG